MKITKEFNYSINQRAMIFPLVFFAICGAVLFREAMTNDRGVINNKSVFVPTRVETK